MKCHSSFRTIEQNKSGCLLLLGQKNLAKYCGLIQLVSFNTCTFILYSNVWPFILNVMLFLEPQYNTFHGTSIEQINAICQDSVFI